MTKRILIVDDHQGVRRGLRALLGDNSAWEICAEAADGHTGVAKALESSPDLIILDLVMPGLDGLTAAQEIRKRLPSVPVVLNTLYGTAELQLEAYKHGIARVVEKTEPAALMTAVEDLLSESAILQPTVTSGCSEVRGTPTPAEPAVPIGVEVVTRESKLENSKHKDSEQSYPQPGKSF